MDRDISVNANTYVKGNLTVYQYATMDRDISVNANTYVKGNLTVYQYATMDRDISVNANTYVKGNLTVYQHATVTRDLSVNANAYVKGNLTVYQHATMERDISVNANTYVKGNLTVYQYATMNRDISVNANSYVSGSTTIFGELTVGGYDSFWLPFPNYSIAVTVLRGTGSAGINCIAIGGNRMVFGYYGSSNANPTRCLYFSTYSGSAWNAPIAFDTAASENITGIQLTSDGSRGVTSTTSGLCKYFTWNGSVYTARSNVNTETTTRTYLGIAMTANGSKIVTSTGNALYFAVWSGTSYNAFISFTNLAGADTGYPSLSSDGSIVTISSTASKQIRWASWNGSNYGAWKTINDLTTYVSRTQLSPNGTVLFVSDNGGKIYYSTYNSTISNYDKLVQIQANANPLTAGVVNMGISPDSYSLYYFNPAVDTTSIYKTDITQLFNKKDLYVKGNTFLNSYATVTNDLNVKGSVTIGNPGGNNSLIFYNESIANTNGNPFNGPKVVFWDNKRTANENLFIGMDPGVLRYNVANDNSHKFSTGTSAAITDIVTITADGLEVTGTGKIMKSPKITLGTDDLATTLGDKMPKAGGTFTGDVTMNPGKNIILSTTSKIDFGTTESEKIILWKNTLAYGNYGFSIESGTTRYNVASTGTHKFSHGNSDGTAYAELAKINSSGLEVVVSDGYVKAPKITLGTNDLQGLLNAKAPSASPSLTGLVTITHPQTTSTNAYAFEIMNSADPPKSIKFATSLGIGDWNGLVQTGDSAIFASGANVEATNTNVLCLTTHSKSVVGVRITSSDVIIKGNLTGTGDFSANSFNAAINYSLTSYGGVLTSDSDIYIVFRNAHIYGAGWKWNNSTQWVAYLSIGGVFTGTSFNAISDYRIKDNVKPIDLSNINIDSLNPVTYLNKKTKTQDIGLIAHEVQEIFPYLVNGEKDGKDMQSICYMSLIGLLIKEVQELKSKMKEKEKEVQELKSKEREKEKEHEEKEPNPNKTLLTTIHYNQINQPENANEPEKIIQIPNPGFYLVVCGANYENPNITTSFWATVGQTSTVITPIQIPETYQVKSSPDSNAIRISAKLDPQYTEFDVKYTKFA
jgi:hypothetical protein